MDYPYGNQEWLSTPERRAAMFQHLHQCAASREAMVQAEIERVIEAGPRVNDTVALGPHLRGRVVRIGTSWPVMAEVEVWRPSGKGGTLYRCTEERELRHLRAIEEPLPPPQQETAPEALPGLLQPALHSTEERSDEGEALELPAGNDAPVLLEAAEGPAEGYAEPR